MQSPYQVGRGPRHGILEDLRQWDSSHEGQSLGHLEPHKWIPVRYLVWKSHEETRTSGALRAQVAWRAILDARSARQRQQSRTPTERYPLLCCNKRHPMLRRLGFPRCYLSCMLFLNEKNGC